MSSLTLHEQRQQTERIRWWILGVLCVLSVGLAFFVPPRHTDPLAGWLVIETLVGAILFWPLSRVLIRVAGRWMGLVLALIPPVCLTVIRFLYGHRDVKYGSPSTVPLAAIVFFGVFSMALYLVLRSPSPNADE